MTATTAKRGRKLTRLRPHWLHGLHMRPIIVLLELHLAVPLERAIPALAPPEHHFVAVAAFQRLERQVVDRLTAAEVEKYTLGFCEGAVVGFLCDFEEGFGVGCFDGHCCVDDELQGRDLFGGGSGGGHGC